MGRGQVAARTVHAPATPSRAASRPQAVPDSAPADPAAQADAAPTGGASARERALVAGVLAGSRAHFDELYSSHFPRIYRFALKRLGDSAEAEDVTQEVFETILKALPSYRGDSSLIVWIFGITRNKVNRRFRSPRMRLESVDDGDCEELAGGEAPADRAVDARRVLNRCEEVIERELTPLQRRIFHLKHLRRQSIRAIADALGKSEDAIKANLYRMRRVLADGVPGLDSVVAP